MAEKKRVVVKAGTAIITEESGRINRKSAGELVRQLADIKAGGADVILVSSGAIAAGMEKMHIDVRPEDIETLQAVASVGQGLLVQMYADLFREEGVTVGQVLLTQQDMSYRQHYLNARSTLNRLLKMGVLPVVNENDTVATDEITFGDNDMLAGLVSTLVEADLMILLTDIGGLYTADPRISDDAMLIERVEKITRDIEDIGGEAGSRVSTGGMSSKIQAVKVAASTGVNSLIANGKEPGILTRIISGEKTGTYFPASGRVGLRKHWIGYAKKSSGKLVIDEGASHALVEGGRSLLPAGVKAVEGKFHVGDSVDIVDESGELVGRGVSSYSSDEADRIKGLRSDRICEVLGEAGEEIIHRDVLIVFKEKLG
ncbi:MAG: glutamate 5-kinase [Actinobacteria bacterium]|nr:glutamate 5-kinase [Actinomycetota bacterium]